MCAIMQVKVALLSLNEIASERASVVIQPSIFSAMLRGWFRWMVFSFRVCALASHNETWHRHTVYTSYCQVGNRLAHIINMFRTCFASKIAFQPQPNRLANKFVSFHSLSLALSLPLCSHSSLAFSRFSVFLDIYSVSCFCVRDFKVWPNWKSVTLTKIRGDSIWYLPNVGKYIVK